MDGLKRAPFAAQARTLTGSLRRRTNGDILMATIGRRRDSDPYVLDKAAQGRFHRDWNDLSVKEKLKLFAQAIERLERRDRKKRER